jgi:hypothetical protein
LASGPRHVTSFLVNVSGDTERHFWTALRLEKGAAAVVCLGSIEKRIPIIDQLAGRGENLASRTNVNVLLRSGSLPD